MGELTLAPPKPWTPKRTGRSLQCKARLFSGNLDLNATAASVRASVIKHGRTDATGLSFAAANGGSDLILNDPIRLGPGSYTLILRRRRGKTWSTSRTPMSIG